MMDLIIRILLIYIWIVCSCTIQLVSAQPDITSARALNALLQDYAYRAFIRPKTGVVYDGAPPSNLTVQNNILVLRDCWHSLKTVSVRNLSAAMNRTCALGSDKMSVYQKLESVSGQPFDLYYFRTGIKISAMRLRSGSLRRRGVSAYKEFRIPIGVIEQPFVTRLVLVYHNLGNWSTLYYPLPNGYTYISPVLGLLAYDASNLSAINLPELNLRAFGQPISIQFSVPNRSDPKCVWFGLNGSVIFTDIISENICSTYQLGHFSVVIESGKKKNKNRVWIVVGSVLGGLVLLIMLAIIALVVYNYQNKKKMQRMESAAEAGEAFEMTSVGNTRAPSATVTRTQPSLETEYMP